MENWIWMGLTDGSYRHFLVYLTTRPMRVISILAWSRPGEAEISLRWMRIRWTTF